MKKKKGWGWGIAQNCTNIINRRQDEVISRMLNRICFKLQSRSLKNYILEFDSKCQDMLLAISPSAGYVCQGSFPINQNYESSY